MNTRPTLDDLFEQRTCYPDPDARDRYNRLVGIDEQKSRLAKTLSLIINKQSFLQWINKYHKGADQLIGNFGRRPPLVILSGDVGSGKTELAETAGDLVARNEDTEIQLYPMSLSTRGQGRVGEMTQLISSAFDITVSEAEKLKSTTGKHRGGIILLIDEADALAQSRESSQMHHEDRAGVNSFIRGIDRIANGQLPAAVIMCTNRLSALDPAIRRRAADVIRFSRPTDIQRAHLLKEPLQQLGFSSVQVQMLAKATGPKQGREFGFTFSDLTQRLIPAILMDAYPTKAVTAQRAMEIANSMDPTPPFKDNDR